MTGTASPNRFKGSDHMLAPLRRHWRWTLLGVIVALLATATRFVAIGILPPSVKLKPFAHADASTEAVLQFPGNQTYGFGSREPYGSLTTRTYALADMVDSPQITGEVARAAGVPVSKVGILGPLWTELWRSQQWANGPKRASQIVIEQDPYQVTINQETNPVPGQGPGPGPGPTVIDIETQAPSPEVAARLARAVPVALNAYLERAQTAARTPERDRYEVSQLVPVAVEPARKSQVADVTVFTFVAVCVLWWGAEIVVSALMRDLRTAAVTSEAGDDPVRLLHGAKAGAGH